MEANKNSFYRLQQTTTLQKKPKNILVDTDSSYYTNSTCSRYNKHGTSDSEWIDSYRSDKSIVDSTNDKSIKNTYKTRIKIYLNNCKSQINTGTSNGKLNINSIKLTKG